MNDETTPHQPAEGDDADWLRSLGDAAIEPSAEAHPGPEVGPTLPPIDRERPVRPPLVPQWVWITLGVLAAVVALIAIVGTTIFFTARVPVIDVTGLQLGVARARLAQDSLQVSVVEERFSSAPKNEILEQTPAAGEKLLKGSTITVVVSAGTEDFTMPDVVGDGIALARGTLESGGLVVVIEPVTSDAASDTVLSTDPAPGATVRTGDTVRVQVASPSAGGAEIRPFNLQGLTVSLDPEPVASGTTDATMDVARRLRSLLEASGASVTILRSALDTATAAADRAQRATETSATVGLGFSTTETGPEGRVVLYPAAGAPVTVSSSAELASAIASSLAEVAPPVTSKTVDSDEVLSSAAVAWVRVGLGSGSQRNDKNAWADTTWADRVARALYAAVGSLYGAPEVP